MVILFAVPILIILVMGYAFSDSETTYHLGIINNDGNTESAKKMIDNFKKVSALSISTYSNENEANVGFEKDHLCAYFVIPKGFDKNHNTGNANVKLVLDNSKPVNASAVKGIIQCYVEKYNTYATSVLTATNVYMNHVHNANPESVVEESMSYLNSRKNDAVQLKVENKEIVSHSMTSFNQTTCGMTAMFILFLCILWGSGNILEEKLTGTMTRLSLAPVGFSTIMSSKLTYIGILAFLQFAIFFGIGHNFLGVPVGNIFLLILVNIVFIISAASMGLLISIIAKSRMLAIGLSFFIIMLLSPLGGLWFPLETVPISLQNFATFLPTGSYMKAMNEVIIKNNGFADIALYLTVILIYFAVSFIAGILLQQKKAGLK